MKISQFRAHIRRLYLHPNTSVRTVSINQVSPTPIATVDPRYLSFSIDISVLVGGHWWEGSNKIRRGLGIVRTHPVDLNSKKLDRLVRALSPAFLRVGGSEADKIDYFTTPPELRNKNSVMLTQEIWDQLNAFVQRNNLALMFTFKYGIFDRSQHGEWRQDQVKALLDYSKKKDYVIDVCELGNELNAYWAFHGVSSQPMAKKLAKDYRTFIQLIRTYNPDSKVCGPGSAFWPKLGEAIAPFTNLTKKFLESLQAEGEDCPLDIIDWHYYAFQSKRSPVRTRTAKVSSLLSPRSHKYFPKYAQSLCTMRDQYQPQAEVWTGETGSAQCGGEARVSDRFASCFWWANQLGLGALNGQKVMVRQSLLGGEYCMIHRDTLKPLPDYWVSWLWGELMGEEVYQLSSSSKFLNAYCHSKKGGAGKVILLVNCSRKKIALNTEAGKPPSSVYTITAKKLTSKKVYINNIRPKMGKEGLALSDFDGANHVLDIIPPHSIQFCCFDEPVN